MRRPRALVERDDESMTGLREGKGGCKGKGEGKGEDKVRALLSQDVRNVEDPILEASGQN